ncbi:hypothetical protein BSL78_15096 [Apostichopus japonicus]|uniref:Uncharacterized protein n=1 Tax=Stichopus japonicus TaxID=307972 RepID=A0A2G8KJ68_STIJA|nr:hypothetical protein BSL78_15096 [Apostichopus japonicus]
MEGSHQQLVDFLVKNEFQDTTIEAILKEQITVDDVLRMSLDELIKVVPSLTERLKLRNFCAERQSAQSGTNEKRSLLEKLALKMNAQSATSKLATSKPTCSKNAEKESRFIEVGLACFSKKENRYKAIRSSKGGGTRRLSLKKNSFVRDVLKESKELFFPNGSSPIDSDDIVELPGLDSVVHFGPFTEACSQDIEETVLFDCRTSTPIPLFEGEVIVDVAQVEPTVSENLVTKPKKTLTIHREKVLEEMILAFKSKSICDCEIDVVFILPNGERESGEGSGVWRDVLTAFWEIFRDNITLGKNFKVPYLRHDFQSAQWESVARIILKGFQTTGYFPTFLAPPFVEYSISSKVAPDTKVLEAFFQYVPDEEREIFQRALDDFTAVDLNELIDILDIYQCKVLPTALNFGTILHEISHKELIQQPSFVAECWRGILKPLQTVSLSDLYDTLQPTVKKVLNKLSAPRNMNAVEEATVITSEKIHKES